MSVTLRKYAPIWEQLKQTDIVEVKVVHRLLIPRVRQGVIKEKCNDLGWKIMNYHKDFRLQVSYDPEKECLVFRLVQRYGIEEKVVT